MVGVGIRVQLVVKQVLEYSCLYVLQKIAEHRWPFGDASLETDLVVDLKADLCSNVPQSVVH